MHPSILLYLTCGGPSLHSPISHLWRSTPPFSYISPVEVHPSILLYLTCGGPPLHSPISHLWRSTPPFSYISPVEVHPSILLYLTCGGPPLHSPISHLWRSTPPFSYISPVEVQVHPSILLYLTSYISPVEVHPSILLYLTCGGPPLHSPISHLWRSTPPFSYISPVEAGVPPFSYISPVEVYPSILLYLWLSREACVLWEWSGRTGVTGGGAVVTPSSSPDVRWPRDDVILSKITSFIRECTSLSSTGTPESTNSWSPSRPIVPAVGEKNIKIWTTQITFDVYLIYCETISPAPEWNLRGIMLQIYMLCSHKDKKGRLTDEGFSLRGCQTQPLWVLGVVGGGGPCWGFVATRGRAATSTRGRGMQGRLQGSFLGNLTEQPSHQLLLNPERIQEQNL